MSTANLNTPEYWDQVYRHEWESGLASSPEYNRDYGPIHDAIIGLISDGDRVLDMACGAGVLCRKIKQRRPRCAVMGVDFSPYTIGRNQHHDQGLGIEYGCLDLRLSLGTLGREFDVVTMCEILEHLEEPQAVVHAALGLLKPGGRFILTCPHDDAIPDPEHLRCWGHDEVFHLLAPYSDTISFVHFPPPYFHTWLMAYLIKSPSGAQPEVGR